MRNMTKPILHLLFAVLITIGFSNQVSAAETNPKANDPSAEKGWLEGVMDSFTSSEATDSSVWIMLVYLIMGGVLALYIRFLYRHCNTSVSNADSVARIFPLLTMVTVGVIAVVKSSLALSLGLVGALSIVRFRAAIKDPEELVYLFLCIGIGLALGAEQPLLAIAIVGVSTVFILGIHFTTGKSRQQNLLLTITGDANKHFREDDSGVMNVVEQLVGRYTLQRYDLEQGRGQVRIVINRKGGQETAQLIEKLRAKLPECEFSYVNLESTL